MTARISSPITWASTGRQNCGPNLRPTVVLEVVLIGKLKDAAKNQAPAHAAGRDDSEWVEVPF